MADGAVIQDAATQALRGGMTLRRLLDQLKDVRSEVCIPLILMGYLNPIMQYGFERLCQVCQAYGIDGLIIPDLPFKDYIEEYRPIAERYDVRIIMLITPETSEERIREIDRHTEGFIYMVSSAAITGPNLRVRFRPRRRMHHREQVRHALTRRTRRRKKSDYTAERSVGKLKQTQRFILRSQKGVRSQCHKTIGF